MGATVPFEKVTEELFDDFLNVHYKGIYFLTQKLLPFFNNNGEKRVLHFENYQWQER